MSRTTARDFYNTIDYKDWIYSHKSYVELEHDFKYDRPDLSHHFCYEGICLFIYVTPTGLYSLKSRGLDFVHIADGVSVEMPYVGVFQTVCRGGFDYVKSCFDYAVRSVL